MAIFSSLIEIFYCTPAEYKLGEMLRLFVQRNQLMKGLKHRSLRAHNSPSGNKMKQRGPTANFSKGYIKNKIKAFLSQSKGNSLFLKREGGGWPLFNKTINIYNDSEFIIFSLN